WADAQGRLRTHAWPASRPGARRSPAVPQGAEGGPATDRWDPQAPAPAPPSGLDLQAPDVPVPAGVRLLVPVVAHLPAVAAPDHRALRRPGSQEPDATAGRLGLVP